MQYVQVGRVTIIMIEQVPHEVSVLPRRPDRYRNWRPVIAVDGEEVGMPRFEHGPFGRHLFDLPKFRRVWELKITLSSDEVVTVASSSISCLKLGSLESIELFQTQVEIQGRNYTYAEARRLKRGDSLSR